jgi:hypothetical protein
VITVTNFVYSYRKISSKVARIPLTTTFLLQSQRRVAVVYPPSYTSMYRHGVTRPARVCDTRSYVYVVSGQCCGPTGCLDRPTPYTRLPDVHFSSKSYRRSGTASQSSSSFAFMQNIIAVPERKPMSGVDRPTLRMAPAPECTGNGVTVGHKPRGC